MITKNELSRRKKISNTMKKYRANNPIWNKGKKCPNISKSLKGSIPWNKGTRGKMGLGKNHPNWRGGKYKMKAGYIKIYKPNHPKSDCVGYILEHRYIMSKHLERPLESYEHIHHINNKKDDNRIENLEIISRSDHIKIHFYHGFTPNRKII